MEPGKWSNAGPAPPPPPLPLPPKGLSTPQETRHGHHEAGLSHRRSIVHWASDQAANLITIWQTLGLWSNFKPAPITSEYQVIKQKSREGNCSSPFILQMNQLRLMAQEEDLELERADLCWGFHPSTCWADGLGHALGGPGPLSPHGWNADSAASFTELRDWKH